MKKTLISSSLSTLLLLCILFACKNELGFVDPNSSNDPAILAAKEWYDNKDPYFTNFRIGQDSLTDYYRENRPRLKPNWDDTRIEKLERDYDGVIVETDTLVLLNESVGFFRVFIFKEKDNQIFDGRIVEFYGEKSFFEENSKKLPKQYRNKSIAGFSGAIVSYDIDYNYLESYSFKDGLRQDGEAFFPQMTNKKSNDPTQGRIGSTLRTQLEDGEGCWDVYWDTFQFNCMCITSSVYLYTYCNYPQGGGTEAPLPPAGFNYFGGGGATYENPTAQAGIKVELENECIKAVWNQVKNQNFNNTIQQILYEFNKSQSIVATFKEEYVTSKPKTVAWVDPATKVVTFNTYALKYAKKEAMLTTILHEVLHLYLELPSELDEHQTIITRYIPAFKALLLYWYPGIGGEHAEALAYYGLGQTEYWRKDMNVNLRNHFVDIQDKYFNYNNDHDPAHTYGIPCPN